ncbi:MAG: hypothetical protein WB626_01780 [Bacteroidota bacterium]
MRSERARTAILTGALLAFACGGCDLFSTREPEPPSDTNCFPLPPTRPSAVLANLQSAVAQKCVDTYAACFGGGGRFVFLPSSEAREQYGALMDDWGTAEEQAWFRNLVARGLPNGFSTLILTPRDSVIASDSVVYNFDYTFRFEHTLAGFPAAARGNLQFTLTPDAGNNWSITRWADFKTTDDITWSLFKGKFSN